MSDERDVQEVIARYVRAADNGDRHALARLFMADGCIEFFDAQTESLEPTEKIEGSVRIGNGLAENVGIDAGLRRHQATHDAIVSIHGDKATIDVRFIVFGAARATSQAGTLAGNAAPARATIIETGGYRANLKRHEGGWRIAALRITRST